MTAPTTAYTLTGLKVYESMSEETLCFEATLRKNGKIVARISNRGIGGCNEYDFKNTADLQAFRSWVKEQPPIPNVFFKAHEPESDDNRRFWPAGDPDLWVDEAITRLRNDKRSAIRTLLRKAGNKLEVYELKLPYARLERTDGNLQLLRSQGMTEMWVPGDGWTAI